MCNDQHRPTLHGPVNCFLYQMLTLCIKSTCSLGGGRKEDGGSKEEEEEVKRETAPPDLIQQQDVRVEQEGPCYGNPLLLSP